MLCLKYNVHVLFRNSHLDNDFNFNMTGLRHVQVEVEVGFATCLLKIFVHVDYQKKYKYLKYVSIAIYFNLCYHYCNTILIFKQKEDIIANTNIK